MIATQHGENMPLLPIRTVAVLGAGVMGAQIAAHCANAGVQVLLFDLPADGPDPSGNVRRSIAQLGKLKPAPLAAPELAADIVPANYEQDLGRLAQCDLVIEAIAERADWKAELYRRVAPALAAHTVLASNTSGLSLAGLAQALPEALRPRFCGVHFFNPPRYLSLVELTPAGTTDLRQLDALEAFLTRTLGKNVVRAKDTPNFIGNRIGVFGILSALIQAERYGLSYDVVDDLTGTRLGRTKSATLRTADVVGLDTLAHVIGTLRDDLPDDPFHAWFAVPHVLSALVAQGALGQKTGAGFYRKDGKTRLRLDPSTARYVPADQQADPQIAALLADRDPARRLAGLRASQHPQARFVWALLRDTFHYAAVHLHAIADTARDVDQAMRWGFGHALGPFELWQAAGWKQVADWVSEDIVHGKALSTEPLPDWVHSPAIRAAGGVHTPQGSYQPDTDRFAPPRSLPVYQRQVVPAWLPGQADPRVPAPIADATIVLENDAARLWTLPAPHPQAILIATLKTKMHTLSPAATDTLLDAVDIAQRDFHGLVIWNGPERFSAGADLKAMLPLLQTGGPPAIELEQRKLQTLALRLRYAPYPTVAALAGLTLGGGCELAVHCARRVAHIETYIGLVEVGVGLIPGAGGLAFGARSAAQAQARYAPQAPLLHFLQGYAQAVANAQVSTSAQQALSLGYLQPEDPIVMHPHELLYVAVREAAALADAGWRPPVPRPFRVAGRDGAATLTAQLVNLREAGYISDYDFELGRTLAQVLCGGDVDPGSMVDDAWMLGLERHAFLGLLAQPKTLERIQGMLATGKPVRN